MKLIYSETSLSFRGLVLSFMIIVGIIMWHVGRTQFVSPLKQIYPASATTKISTADTLLHSPSLNRFYNQFECQTFFPELYKEIERAVSLYHTRGGISLHDIVEAEIYDKRKIRIQIINNNLYISKFYDEIVPFHRAQAVFSDLYRAIVTSSEPLPDIDAVMWVDDAPKGSDVSWAFDRREDQKLVWLMPDYGFWSWPEPKVGTYEEVRRNAFSTELKTPWNCKIPRLFWRGAALSNLRVELIAQGKKYEWADIKAIDWSNLGEGERDRLSMGEHCKFKYLFHIEGIAYSGRLKYLLNCKSVTVMHKLEWIQHFHHLLITSGPKQNVVELSKEGMSSLAEDMEQILADDTRSEQIALNAWNDLREKYLTPAATNCYWREFIRGYASVLNFKPSITNTSVPYESVILMNSNIWTAF